MIVRLTGVIVELSDGAVVIERGGIAREVLVPAYTITELAARIGQEIALHTVEFLEGNGTSSMFTPRLLGFTAGDDRTFFTRFIAVKGLGPRKALKALSEPVAKIAHWIETGDAKALAKLPGIGPRAAEMIVATLKGKMEDLALGASASPEPVDATYTEAQRDAVEILVAWGDPRAEAQRWIERAAAKQPNIDAPDDWVRAAYRVKTGVDA